MKALLILVFSISIFICSFGQNRSVMFVGIAVSEYSAPVIVSNGQYKAYFKNLGRTSESGYIIVNESNRRFTIRWTNGDEWIAKFLKKEVKSEKDDFFGLIDKTVYNGIWTDDQSACSLEVIVKKNDGRCFFQLNSQKVIAPEYKIDTWKKKFVFYTMEKCLE